MTRTRSWMSAVAIVSLAGGGAALPFEHVARDRHAGMHDVAAGGAAAGRVWPQPPARPVVRFVETIGSPRDLGARTSLFGRLGHALLGRGDERLIRPAAVAVTGAGKDRTIYVADPGARALYVVTGSGRASVRKIAKAGEQPLVSPVGVAAGNRLVYVSDSVLKRIFVFDRKGRFLRAFGGGELARPTGLALDQRLGRLYVADTAAHRIVAYDEDGRQQTSFGARGIGDGQFNYPTHLGLDAAGSLHVVDSLNYRVTRFDPGGAFLAKFGRHGDGSGDFASPKGISVDTRGYVYVVDALFDAVQIFESTGRLLLTFGERGVGPGQLWLPSGVAVDGSRIYVADSYNQRLQVFEFVGDRDGGL